ncbi:MAG: adenine phosphoribosyltransferase [Dehalococcoidia bacterium]|jgi:adenine phosphoribosyltransferase|nr:adenine phosphoribosyltransferase [Dehalococcoidia bacterium]
MAASSTHERRWRNLIRAVPDFPEAGILYRDITPLLHDSDALRAANDALAVEAEEMSATVIAGIESRGFLFGVAVAERLGLPFVPLRKAGRLPAETEAVTYDLEYGTDTLELHRDPSVDGHRVVVVDDLLATGGTAEAAGRLVRAVGGQAAGYAFLVELPDLGGRDRLTGSAVSALVQF